MFGFLIRLKSGEWFVEYKEGFYPMFYTSLYPLVPWMEVEEEDFSKEIIVAFVPVLRIARESPDCLGNHITKIPMVMMARKILCRKIFGLKMSSFLR
ncbi:hypothetical protein EB077_09835 [bacterium]|nr:hypothetical protein [bacterium]